MSSNNQACSAYGSTAVSGEFSQRISDRPVLPPEQIKSLVHRLCHLQRSALLRLSREPQVFAALWAEFLPVARKTAVQLVIGANSQREHDTAPDYKAISGNLAEWLDTFIAQTDNSAALAAIRRHLYRYRLNPAFIRHIDNTLAELSSPGLPAHVRQALGTIRRWQRKVNLLVEHNYRLGFKFARKYENQGLDFDDLMQLAAIGLMAGAERFDPFMGRAFSTYVSSWVKLHVQRGVMNTGRLVRYPVHFEQNLRRLLAERYKREEAGDEADLMALADEFKMTENFKTDLSQAPVFFDSMDRPIEEEDGATVADFVPDEYGDGADESIAEQQTARIVSDALSVLSEAQREVVKLRYGLGGDDGKTVSEVAAMIGYTPQWVRELENQALAHLGGHLGTEGAQLVADYLL